MKANNKDIEKYIKELQKEQKEMLNSKDFDHYKTEFGNGENTTAEIIDCLDIDSIEFNAGFEQGWMFCLQHIQRFLNN